MSRYYAEKLSAKRLRRCYEIAPPRVRQYLEAEVEHALKRVGPTDAVLELGCGYGRVLVRLARKARQVVGIDNAPASLVLAREYCASRGNVYVAAMDAAALAFREQAFDAVVCIQNGVSAFAADPLELARGAVRITKPGGRVLFSSYAERFWPHRLEWFERQAAEGLLGAIDREQTRDGVIVCRDGFRAGTFSPAQFGTLAESLGLPQIITEVDDSSLFCEFSVE